MKRVARSGFGFAYVCAAAMTFASGLAAIGCGGSAAMQAARGGDRAGFARMLAARQSAGTLSSSEAASLARAVAARDLGASPPAESAQRVRDLSPCAHELDTLLADRMRTHDGAGADAALARVGGRGLDLGDARAFAGDPDPQWRAVGARGLVRPEDREARLHALVDDDPRVRRQAARASRDAADARDLQVLAEAARLDPAPLVRTEAVRSLAALPPTPGGETANVLRDLWNGPAPRDEGLRQDLALAWASPPVWDAGGREALRILVASEHGSGAIEAAAAILRHGDAPPELVDAATAQLTRSIDSGSRAGRLQAIAQSPTDRKDLLDALHRAAADGDPEVRVGALSRLAQSSTHDRTDGDAVAALEALAQPGSGVAASARYALASAGDRRVQAWIEGSLTAPSPDERLGAAAALATLGVPARAAPLLADADPAVRTRAACTILMGVRASH